MTEQHITQPSRDFDLATKQLPPQFGAWVNRFRQTQQSAYIPDILGLSHNQWCYSQRAMVLNLSSILAELTTTPPTIINLFVDTLYLTPNTNWLIDQSSVTIVARQLIVGENVSIALDPSRNAGVNLSIYAQRCEGLLEIIGPQGTVYPFDPSQGLGSFYQAGGDDLLIQTQTSLPSDQATLTSDLGMVLAAQFQYATILSGSDRPLAKALATWIRRATLQSPELFDLGSQAAALEIALNTLSSSTTFVPILSKTMYLDLAKAYHQAVVRFEDEYSVLQRDRQNIQLWQQVGALWANQRQTENAFIEQQIADAETTWLQAKAAVRVATNSFTQQQLLIGQTKTNFEMQLKFWIEQKKLEMAGKIIMGIFSVVQALASFAAMTASAVATGGATAGGAAGSGVATVATFQEAVQNGVKLAMEAADQGSSLAKTFEGLATFIEKMQAVIESITNLVSIAGENQSELTEHAETAAQLLEHIPNVPAELDLACIPTWEQFRLESSLALEAAISNEVPSARDYQLQLDLLVEYGKALTANQFGLVKAGQELARLKLQQRFAQSQTAHIQGFLNQLNRQSQAPLQLQQLLNLHYLNLKRSLFIALQHYVWAFRYWALRPSRIKPNLERRARELIADLATAQQEYALAEASFKPQPQAFDKTVMLDHPALLDQLRTTGSVTIPIGLDHETFAGLDRVRIERVRVWLDGVIGGASSRVRMTITTSGNYADRLGEQNFSFSTEPLQRDFEYVVRPAPLEPKIEIDGAIYEEHRLAYAMPTPFTEWTISLNERIRNRLNWEHVQALSLEFKGSMISQG